MPVSTTATRAPGAVARWTPGTRGTTRRRTRRRSLARLHHGRSGVMCVRDAAWPRSRSSATVSSSCRGRRLGGDDADEAVSRASHPTGASSSPRLGRRPGPVCPTTTPAEQDLAAHDERVGTGGRGGPGRAAPHGCRPSGSGPRRRGRGGDGVGAPLGQLGRPASAPADARGRRCRLDARRLSYSAPKGRPGPLGKSLTCTPCSPPRILKMCPPRLGAEPAEVGRRALRIIRGPR